MGTGYFLGVSGQGVNLTPHLHLVPRTRMNGVLPLLPLYVFMVLTGKTFLLLELIK